MYKVVCVCFWFIFDIIARIRRFLGANLNYAYAKITSAAKLAKFKPLRTNFTILIKNIYHLNENYLGNNSRMSHN